MQGCGWAWPWAADQPERTAGALAASIASRYALPRRRWRERCAPGRLRQPGHCLALRARRRRPRGRCAPGRPHVLPRLRTLSSGGGGDVDDVVRCALLERLGARRTSSSCRGRGWGRWHTARASVPPPPPHSSGAPVRWLKAHGTRAARERRRRRSKVSRRRRAGRAPPGGRRPQARRGKRVRACRARSNGWRKPCGGGGGTRSEIPTQAGFP